MPKVKIPFFLVLLTAMSASARPASSYSVASPNGDLKFTIQITDSFPCYSVYFKGARLIENSPLSLTFRGSGEFGRGVAIHSPGVRMGEDNYSLVVGKASTVHDTYREADIPLEEKGGTHRAIDLIVRVFNDGVAFQYFFRRLGLPTQDSSFILTDERTSFRFAGDPMLLAPLLPNFTTSHEHRYTHAPLSKIQDDTLMDMPILVEFPNKVYMGITEAQLVDYAGMYLVKHEGMLRGELSPLPEPTTLPAPVPGTEQPSSNRPSTLPGYGSTKVRSAYPHNTPWRVLLISDRAGALIESNIITDLNDPTSIQDLSWLKPGKTDFHWWNGDILPDSTISPGINFETNQYYIDFCARNKIEYHTVIGFGGIAWYKNDGISYAPGPHSDVTIPIPGLDMKQICDYARSKGVGIRVWTHWQVLYPEIDKAFDQFEKWGISGLMVDFLDRDDQRMVNIQTEILQKAAAHHLHIQFHGAYKPTGLSRTYPNEFTREGTLNYENDKWGNPITPGDDMNIPFTRLLAGSTDYHLGGFRAVPTAKYKERFTRPLVLGTRCHMLAMYVVLENAIAMVCDYPEAYEGQPGFDFIQQVPTTWDETKVPAAEPMEYVSIARRKGDTWYVGTITNDSARTISLPLNFLQPGNYEATIYSDSTDSDVNANHLTIEKKTVQPSDNLSIKMAPGGGQAIIIRKQ